MDTLLSFFSDLVLFTAGLVVILFWIVIFVVVGIELYDLVHDKRDESEDR